MLFKAFNLSKYFSAEKNFYFYNIYSLLTSPALIALFFIVYLFFGFGFGFPLSHKGDRGNVEKVGEKVKGS